MNVRIPILKMTVGGFLARAVLLLIVIVWTVPTFGLLISSLRDKDQLAVSGWWEALQTTETEERGRTATVDAMAQNDAGEYVISGNLFTEGSNQTLQSFGVRPPEGGRPLADANPAGEAAEVASGGMMTVYEDGRYEWVQDEPFTEEQIGSGEPFVYAVSTPPRFTLENYNEVLTENAIGQAFINTFTVTIPATIIPIAIAAFASYAFSWMQFPGRQLLFAIVVGLLVVPLQMSLIPLLTFYNGIGIGKTYLGIWLAHSAFGLPLAIYLLRNYIGGLPREIIESAKIDGASHFAIFTQLILPLSYPALASFAIFQFLWVWNDLLVALVFLSKDADQIVLTSQIRELIGSRGDNWEILTSSAFVSMIVPLIVFFSLQRYFVRGMLAGSVKGG
ncbi:MAG: carbohydrate ABC transporter permease [Anaerolineae bacterium]